MTAAQTLSTPPWAFWSPSSDESIANALRLAGVGPGTRFLDLGCGDGRVLVAAARLGADVRGIEIDPAVAEIARRNLAAAEVRGVVELDDIYSAPLEADVIYAYLTPATLSRLRERLATVTPGTRIVTPRYAIAGCTPTATADDCYLYETPFREQPAQAASGWPWRATVIVLPPEKRVLVPIPFVADSGPMELAVDPQLARAAGFAAGMHSGVGPAAVPIDVIFRPHGAASVIAGAVRAQGNEMTLAAVFSKETHAQWTFGADEGERFRKTLDRAVAAARASK